MNFLRALAFSIIVMRVAAADAAITTQTVSYRSEALDGMTTYIVALPSPLEDGRRYPVLYLLHGATGSYEDWTQQTTVTELLDGRNMILVMPDGGKYGWYIDSPLVRASQYESAICRDLISEVDARFPTIANREHRGIAGLSMGGHGAITLAAKHPDLFGSASSMSGIVQISSHPDKWELAKMLGKQPDALAEWQKNSAVELADVFTTAGVRLLFDTGKDDTTGAVADGIKLDEKLNDLKVEHTFGLYAGKHTWDYWRAHVGEHIYFHARGW